MGVPGLWDILLPAGQTRSMVHLTVVDGFEKNEGGRRGYRVGIDASIWFFHSQWGREGENPELRTMFFRMARLLEVPFLPVFVFDGPERPKVKRGKKVSRRQHWMEDGVKKMATAFGFQWWEAPGEAEAELAWLNAQGYIDAVLSDDGDTFLFGAQVVVRNPSNTLSGNRSRPIKNSDGRDDGKHVIIVRADDILERQDIGLTHGGLILIGLLSGGDYDEDGVTRCGPKIAQGLARCGFGDELVTAVDNLPEHHLNNWLTVWRDAIRTELRTNSRRILGKKYVSLANSIPDSFPNLDVVRSYTAPVTSGSKGKRVPYEKWWRVEPSIADIARVCEMYFEWGVKATVIKRFRSVLWTGAVIRILRRAARDQDAKMNHLPSLDDQGQGIMATPKKNSKRPPKHLAVGTPSKMITKYFSALGLNSPDKAGRSGDDDEDEAPLMVKIHSSRNHASTDGILEYRVEVAPAQLVALAESGIKGDRYLDTEQAQLLSDCDGDDDNDGEDDKEKKGQKKPPPEPSSHLRIWLPACMMEYVQPGLVEEFEEKEAAKAAKKAGKGKGTISKKTGTVVLAPKRSKKQVLSEYEEESEREEIDISKFDSPTQKRTISKPKPRSQLKPEPVPESTIIPKGKQKLGPAPAPSRVAKKIDRARNIFESSSEDERRPRSRAASRPAVRPKATTKPTTSLSRSPSPTLRNKPLADGPELPAPKTLLFSLPDLAGLTEEESDRDMLPSTSRKQEGVSVMCTGVRSISRGTQVYKPTSKKLALPAVADIFNDSLSSDHEIAPRTKPPVISKAAVKAAPVPVKKVRPAYSSTGEDSSPQKKSPRKGINHTSPTKPKASQSAFTGSVRPTSPSPSRPKQRAPMKLSNRVVVNSQAASTEYIEISSSEDDTPLPHPTASVPAPGGREASIVAPSIRSHSMSAKPSFRGVSQSTTLGTFGFAVAKSAHTRNKPSRSFPLVGGGLNTKKTGVTARVANIVEEVEIIDLT
ncbi:hypothetical protein FRB93_001599 [Tulasnella sp. JGI-2019a]|nr:hypothetical protein FRB93_001599 [Tulasnella sp. JGI-2019a]